MSPFTENQGTEGNEKRQRKITDYMSNNMTKERGQEKKNLTEENRIKNKRKNIKNIKNKKDKKRKIKK